MNSIKRDLMKPSSLFAVVVNDDATQLKLLSALPYPVTDCLTWFGV